MTIAVMAFYYFYYQSSNDPEKTEAKVREILNITKNFINLLHWILAKMK
jgi:hypothetical protein